MSNPNIQTPIEDYLDELLRRTHADPRTTRRLLDEAGDHLLSTAGALQGAGHSQLSAEREAVRRLGEVSALTRGSWRRSFVAMVGETLDAALLLGGVGLLAVGVSGANVALMNALLGREFVGGTTILGTGGSTVGEVAQDAVVLRLLAGGLGLIVLALYAIGRRHRPANRVLPAGLIDSLGAAAFAAGAVVLTIVSIDQAGAARHGQGVGFFLSGAVVALAGAVAFCVRSTWALLPAG